MKSLIHQTKATHESTPKRAAELSSSHDTKPERAVHTCGMVARSAIMPVMRNAAESTVGADDEEEELDDDDSEWDEWEW